MSSIPSFDARPFSVKTALVVDADPNVEALLLETLEPSQWVVQHAADDKSALTLVEKRAFDPLLNQTACIFWNEEGPEPMSLQASFLSDGDRIAEVHLTRSY